MRRPPFVLVAGWPGSGKTTLARALAGPLGLSLLAKDDLKEVLADCLGQPTDVEASQQLGRTAVMVLLRAARSCPGAVLDSTYLPYAVPLLQQLPGPLVEVRCQLPRELARDRYRARAASRHPGHLDDLRTDADLWGQPSEPLGIAPHTLVDTGRPVEVSSVVSEVLRLTGNDVDG